MKKIYLFIFLVLIFSLSLSATERQVYLGSFEHGGAFGGKGNHEYTLVLFERERVRNCVIEQGASSSSSGTISYQPYIVVNLKVLTFGRILLVKLVPGNFLSMFVTGLNGEQRLEPASFVTLNLIDYISKFIRIRN